MVPARQEVGQTESWTSGLIFGKGVVSRLLQNNALIFAACWKCYNSGALTGFWYKLAMSKWDYASQVILIQDFLSGSNTVGRVG